MLHLNGLKGRRISSIDSNLRAKLIGSLCTDSRCPKKQNRGERRLYTGYLTVLHHSLRGRGVGMVNKKSVKYII